MAKLLSLGGDKLRRFSIGADKEPAEGGGDEILTPKRGGNGTEALSVKRL